jgi:hypothetical protein
MAVWGASRQQVIGSAVEIAERQAAKVAGGRTTSRASVVPSGFL